MSYFRTACILISALTVIMISSCTEKKSPEDELDIKMNKIAEDYVRLVLKIGQYDPDFVDAYFGPEELKPAGGKNDSLPYDDFDAEADQLLDELDSLAEYSADKLQTLRYKFLYKQIMAAKTRLFVFKGGNLSFDTESRVLYDAVSPSFTEEHYKGILDSLAAELPGDGTLQERFNRYRSRFIIPKDKLDTVFTRAIMECRERTLEKIELPDKENFRVEYVTGKPWGGYNWFRGNSFSVIQVNTDLPVYIDRAVDLAAHEGYPGHHVYNNLIESKLYKGKKWVEYSIYPLFSPASLVAEGTANYGIEIVMPGEERIKFEKEVLFPLAGLQASEADRYYKIESLLSKLNYAVNDAARNYLNGKWNREQTREWIMKYTLGSPERAEHRIKFIEKYRSYVINYNLGKDIVKSYIEKKGGTAKNSEKRWKLFEELLSTPQIASNLMKD